MYTTLLLQSSSKQIIRPNISFLNSSLHFASWLCISVLNVHRIALTWRNCLKSFFEINYVELSTPPTPPPPYMLEIKMASFHKTSNDRLYEILQCFDISWVHHLGKESICVVLKYCKHLLPPSDIHLSSNTLPPRKKLSPQTKYKQ